MSKLLQRANKKIGVSNAAALLIVVSLIGQVLGFLRYKMVNANFSAYGPESTDAYFAAFKIPDFFFFTFAAGALGVAFIPVLAERLEKGDRKGAWALTGSLLNLLAIIMLVIGVIMFVFAEPLIHNVVGSGLSPEQTANAVAIMRLISFNPFLFAVSGVLTNAQQAFGRFFFFAIGPVVYNIAIIISVLLFRESVGLVGLGIGALAGAVLQLGVALLGLLDANFQLESADHVEEQRLQSDTAPATATLDRSGRRLYQQHRRDEHCVEFAHRLDQLLRKRLYPAHYSGHRAREYYCHGIIPSAQPATGPEQTRPVQP
jgi:peptidoglycan biosynthesis protein MviN/MurJ (putative lipid II flippase)